METVTASCQGLLIVQAGFVSLQNKGWKTGQTVFPQWGWHPGPPFYMERKLSHPSLGSAQGQRNAVYSQGVHAARPGPCCPLPLVLELHRHPALPCNSLQSLLSKWEMKCSFIGIAVGYKMFHFIFFFFPLSPYILPGNTLIYGIILANPNPGEHKLVCAW